MTKREMKKMGSERLQSLYEAMRQDALQAIEAGSFACAIRHLEAALKIEEVLIERGIEEV